MLGDNMKIYKIDNDDDNWDDEDFDDDDWDNEDFDDSDEE